MFQIGDRVAYPLHGAGVVQAIEEREVLGVTSAYYMLTFDEERLRVYVPVSRAEAVKLRPIATPEQADEILAFLRQPCAAERETNWNRRYRANLEKLKTGDLSAIAEVVRSLSLRETTRGLSTGESRMLEGARKHLVSELSFAKDVPGEQMARQLDEILRGSIRYENEA